MLNGLTKAHWYMQFEVQVVKVLKSVLVLVV